MHVLDKKIKEIARQSTCKISKEYENRIDSILEQIKNENRITPIQLKRRIPYGYVICALLAIFVVSIPAIAAVDYVKDRMRLLDEQEYEKYQKTVESTQPDTEAIRYSREFDADESRRYQELLAEYEGKGLFPEGELQMIESVANNIDTEETRNADILLFENSTRMLFLPERSLTDEELLEIIDFYHKTDYSLAQKDAVQEAKEKQKELEDALPTNKAISKEQAMELAAHYLAAMFGIQSNDILVDYEETIDSENNGDYLCSYQEGGITYQVVLQSTTAQLTSMEQIQEGVDYYAEPAVIHEDTFIEKADMVKELFFNIYGEDTEIASVTCSYRKDENHNVPRGNVLYYIEFMDGTAARFSYNVNRDIIWQMILFTNYRDMRNAEEEGIREVEPDRVYIEVE